MAKCFQRKSDGNRRRVVEILAGCNGVSWDWKGRVGGNLRGRIEKGLLLGRRSGEWVGNGGLEREGTTMSHDDVSPGRLIGGVWREKGLAGFEEGFGSGRREWGSRDQEKMFM
jgi:hypothetical protein